MCQYKCPLLWLCRHTDHITDHSVASMQTPTTVIIQPATLSPHLATVSPRLTTSTDVAQMNTASDSHWGHLGRGLMMGKGCVQFLENTGRKEDKGNEVTS